MDIGGIIILPMLIMLAVVTVCCIYHMIAYFHEAHLRSVDGDDRFSEMKFSCAYLEIVLARAFDILVKV
jgi:hypothetical protein